MQRGDWDGDSEGGGEGTYVEGAMRIESGDSPPILTLLEPHRRSCLA